MNRLSVFRTVLIYKISMTKLQMGVCITLLVNLLWVVAAQPVKRLSTS